MGFQVTATGGIVHHSGPASASIIPRRVIVSLANYLLDKQTGSFIILVQDGEVRKIKKEIHETM